jgi:REP element-mobilizing transposase RayT
MTKPRSTLVSLDDTSWYHCVCRCVRRAFLCGEDRLTGQNFDHRRGWIAERMKELAQVFAIDIAAYAVMSNHYHLVAHVDRSRALGWTTDEVLARWTRLFSGPPLVARYLSPERAALGAAELARIEAYADCYRTRLHDLSWFMRVLNETIARQANAEDGCTGRFWEGRFKSQALLDEQALLAAMAYVDLNPIRAGIAETPEDSDYTSIRERLADAKTATAEPPTGLMPFEATSQVPWAIPFAFEDYVELVECTGRAQHPTKKGRIPARQPKILARLGLDAEAFMAYSSRLLKTFGSAVGVPASLVGLCDRRQAKYLRGMQAARRVFGGGAGVAA